jgi:hypothetical protein
MELGVIGALLASCASPSPRLGDSRAAAAQASVEHASPDDCAIIAEIGKSELHWSAANAPNALFYPKFETPGRRIYLQDCPWKKLGLAEPRIGTSDSPMGFFITRPIYSGTSAKASFQYSVASVAAAGGKRIPPFAERDLCTLEKDAAGWHLIRCKLMGVR